MKDTARLINLIKNHLYGNLTQEERAELEAWLDESPENRRILERISSGDRFHDRIRFYEKFDRKKTWERIFSDISGAIRSPKNRVRRLKKILIYPAAAAVVGLAVILATFIGRQNQQEEYVAEKQQELIFSEPGQTFILLPDGRQVVLAADSAVDQLESQGMLLDNELSTLTVTSNEDVKVMEEVRLVVPRGVTQKVILPDGSAVTVNAESELIFPSGFIGGTREVTLHGEAFFDVASDKSKTFIVNIGDMSVGVLGTSFNINGYDDDIVTTLVSGRVVVNLDDREHHLIPGQQAVVSSGMIDIRNVDTAKYTAWTRGSFIFANEPLGSILGTLSRWYDTEVEFTSDKLKSLHFTCSQEKTESLNHILQIIETTGIVKFEVEGRKINVYPR